MTARASARVDARASIAIAAVLTLSACGGGGHLARLIEGSGVVERSLARTPDAWQAVKTGEEFDSGDGVRTGAGASAVLELAGGARLRLGPDTTMRLDTGQKKHSDVRIGVETGEAEVEGSDREVAIETSFGVARLEGGARVRLAPQGTSLRVDVLLGKARLDDGVGVGGAILERGEGVVVAMGGAVREHVTVEKAAPRPPRARDAGAPTPARDAGTPAAPPPPVATVTARLTGAPATQRPSDSAPWSPLPTSAKELPVGTWVRVAKKSQLRLERGGEIATVSGPAEVRIGEPSQPLIEAREGEVALAPTRGEVRIAVPGGVIVARMLGGEALTEVTIRPHGATSVRVVRGTAAVTGKSDEALSPGDHATVSEDGAIAAGTAAPLRADLAITIGESPTIHDPRPPTAVRLPFAASCPGTGVIEVPGIAPARGVGTAVIALPVGKHHYKLRCLGFGAVGGNSQSGTITVTRDAGIAALPRGAPHNTVDADGRTYSVLYQNRLPVLTLRWPGAPAAPSYTLRVLDGPRPIVRKVTSATTEFNSGEIGEGSYRFTWEVDGGKKSPETRLRVDFDNAAPTAYVREPADRAAWGGATVHVSGAAIIGSSMSVAGHAVPLDDHQRFAADVPRPDAGEALAVRISHPEHGVHYYLRRTANP